MKQNRNSDKKRHHEETIHDRQYRSMVKRYKWKNHAIIAGALLGFSVLILFIIVSDIPLTAANVAVGLAVLNGACWLLLRLLCRPAYNLSIQIPMKNDGHWLWRGGELIYRELTHDDATCPIPPECLVRVDDRQIIIDNDSTSGRILVFLLFSFMFGLFIYWSFLSDSTVPPEDYGSALLFAEMGVNIFGREKVVFTHRNMQDDNGKMVQYDKRSFLIWDKAGVTAIRNEENVYNISVIYLWVAKNKKSISSLPAPTGLFDYKITIDGTLWSQKADMTTRSGEMEIVASASGGYMEITFARTRDQKITWQNYRKIMVENFQYALIKRDCIKQLEKNIRIGKPTKNLTENVHLLEEMSETFLVCMIQALHAGYAMGRGERYLKSNMLLPLTEAAIKCIEHGTIKSSDMLSVYSGCVLLNCEKMTMKRLSEIMMKNGVRDFVFDTLIRYRIPDWEVTEYTVFPEVKKWITSQTKSRNMTEARATLQKISCISENILIADALITSTF